MIDHLGWEIFHRVSIGVWIVFDYNCTVKELPNEMHPILYPYPSATGPRHHPLREERQADGWIRRWARIPEMENRALRVILLADGETIHNAFFDRDFEE